MGCRSESRRDAVADGGLGVTAKVGAGAAHDAARSGSRRDLSHVSMREERRRLYQRAVQATAVARRRGAAWSRPRCSFSVVADSHGSNTAAFHANRGRASGSLDSGSSLRPDLRALGSEAGGGTP